MPSLLHAAAPHVAVGFSLFGINFDAVGKIIGILFSLITNPLGSVLTWLFHTFIGSPTDPQTPLGFLFGTLSGSDNPIASGLDHGILQVLAPLSVALSSLYAGLRIWTNVMRDDITPMMAALDVGPRWLLVTILVAPGPNIGLGLLSWLVAASSQIGGALWQSALAPVVHGGLNTVASTFDTLVLAQILAMFAGGPAALAVSAALDGMVFLFAAILVGFLFYLILLMVLRTILLVFGVLLFPVVVPIWIYNPRNPFFQWWVGTMTGALLAQLLACLLFGATITVALNTPGSGPLHLLEMVLFLVAGLWFTTKAVHALEFGGVSLGHGSAQEIVAMAALGPRAVRNVLGSGVTALGQGRSARAPLGPGRAGARAGGGGAGGGGGFGAGPGGLVGGAEQPVRSVRQSVLGPALGAVAGGVAAATGAARARSAVPRGQSTAFGGLGDVARGGLQGARQGVREARGTLSRADRADLTGRSRVGRAWLGSIAATEHATIAGIRAQQVAAHATVGRAHAAALAHAAVVDAGGADAEVRAAALASGGAATESLTAGHRTRHAQQVRATAEARRVAGHHQVDRDAESQVAATTAQADTARTTLMTPDQWADHLGERQHQPVATQLRHMSVERAATLKAQRDAIRPPGPGPADPGPRPPSRRTPPPRPPEPSPPAVSSDPPRPDPASPSPPARPASGSPPEPGVPSTPPPRREARRPAGGERPTPSGPPPFAGPSHPAPPSPPPGSGADAERS